MLSITRLANATIMASRGLHPHLPSRISDLLPRTNKKACYFGFAMPRTMSFWLGVTLLVTGAAAATPLAASGDKHTAVAAMAPATAHGLKAHAQSARSSQEKLAGGAQAQTQKAADLSGSPNDPKLAFAQLFGYLIVGALCLMVVGCCVTQRGCLIYDKFLDKEPYNQVAGEEDAATPK